jgi:ATP-dependent exoDNAse (exonuclease V) alpha subunit
MSLTSCQEKALDVVNTTNGNITISGPAGSGKTYLMNSILESLSNKTVAMCAPTHAAKNILSRVTGRDVSTIHKLLKIHPDTYEDQREFKQSGDVEDLDEIDVLIVEESSMIDQDIYDIMGRTIPRDCRIIGIGDKYQIQPVKHAPGVLSPMFTKFNTVEMHEIVRQAADNPIIQVSTDIRNGGWFSTKWSKEQKKGVMKVSDVNRMVDVYLSKIKTPEDLMDYRILAYTNDCVDYFNDLILKEVYKTNDPYVAGEYLVTQQPVMQTVGKFPECIIDNGEVVKILEVKQQTFEGMLPRIENETFDIAVLTVQNEEGNVYIFRVLWDDNQRERFGVYLSHAASTYKSVAGNTKRDWRAFWGLKETMIETKPLGASTFHKSQGSTVKGTCIYTQDMGYAEPEIVQQLAYVACTRATDWCLYN